MRTATILLTLSLAACRASGEGDPDANQPTPDAAANIDAAGQADADTTDADPTAPDADTTDAPIAEGAVINEFVIDTNGTGGSDTDEYIEVFGDPSTDYSALTIVMLDGDVGPDGPGKIMRVYPVGTTNAGGFWVTAMLANQLQNGSSTLLLVDGFSGNVDDDVDTNDDGAFETTPWTSILDAVAKNDGAGTNVTYAGNAELGNVPGASRIPDGADTDTAADWVTEQGDVTAAVGEATYTPGAANAVEP
jgi:uncharacterized protein